jgi:Na+/H+ antiporter NhaC
MFDNNNIRILIYVFSIICIGWADSASAGYIGLNAEPLPSGMWVSILPPLLAISFALVTKRVLPALFLAIWLGAWLINGLSPTGLWTSMLDTFQVYVLNALTDSGHAAVILFSLMIGGMVGIISRNGGMQGIVNIIVRWANSARHTMLATATMGLAIFFDDYANTLVVGNTMRPVTDAMRVSREKLAYIVDSTAAPVACIALVTTWVGYEVGLIGDAMRGIEELEISPYLVYINTIPYSFYPLLALAFVFMVSWSGRDFGPMIRAEQRARKSGVLTDDHLEGDGDADGSPIEPVEGKPQRAMNALIPVVVLVLSVVGGLFVTGRQELGMTDVSVGDILAGRADASLRDVIGAADAYTALMWASLIGMMTAGLLSLGQGILDLEELVAAWYRGLRVMVKAIIIILLAWSLGAVSETLGTADFLVSVLGETLPAWLMPTLVFVLAAATGFGTGSSWGAMAILIPLVIPLTWAIMLGQGIGDAAHMHILYSSIAAVLAGSVWGDHCSPISDTTILSSMASGCNHVDHVRTQLPYAGTVGLVSILTGSLPVALGMPWWLGLLIGLAVLAVILRVLGKSSEPN